MDDTEYKYRCTLIKAIIIGLFDMNGDNLKEVLNHMESLKN